MELLAFQEALCQDVIDVSRAALLFARGIAYPQLRCTRYLARLDELAHAASKTVLVDGTAGERGRQLAAFLFNVQGFIGNEENYADPRNSFLNDVLDRRLGIPISLSVLYLTLAQKLGIPAFGVGLPGHFIVGVDGQDGPLYLDPFHGGRRLDRTGCARLVCRATAYQGAFHERWLRPVPEEQILARMLNNLKVLYIQQENWRLAITVVEHLRALEPQEPRHQRDLGLLHYRAGSPRQAIQLLKIYLQRAPSAKDAVAVQRSLRFVADQYARLN